MTPATFEKIEAYLSKRLKISERKSFDSEISADANLKEAAVRMQLLRKITERSLTRAKIMAIHTAKTDEWMKSLKERENEEPFVEQVQTSAAIKNSISEETELVKADTKPPETELVHEDSDENVENSEIEEELAEDELYEFEETSSGRSIFLSVTLLSLGFLLITGSLFFYLAKTPLTIREGNPLLTAKGVDLDSTQKVYVEIYEEGVESLTKQNNLAAIAHFDNVVSFGNLPGYYIDASHFLNSAAYAQQQPYKAGKLLSSIISKRSFAYPYTNKDKIQIWCKIYWAKIMGFKG